MQYFAENVTLTQQSILSLVPALLLSLFYLNDARRSKGNERKTALFGFLTFIMFFVSDLPFFIRGFLLPVAAPAEAVLPYFLATEVVIVTGLVFMPIWAISMTRPDWLEARKWILVSTLFIIWVGYVGYLYLQVLGINGAIAQVISVLLFINFLIPFYHVLKHSSTERKALILFFGLLLLWMGLSIGLWVVLVWYLISKRLSTTPL